MLQTQPFYVGGIADPEKSARAAYGAAGIFIVCFVASVFGLFCTSRHNLPDIVSHLNEMDDTDIYRSQMQRHFPTPDYAGDSPYIQRASRSRQSTSRGGGSRGSGTLRRRSGGPSNGAPDNPPMTIELTTSVDDGHRQCEGQGDEEGPDSPLSSPLQHQAEQVEDLLGLTSGEFI
jgi:hypothetical protein